MRGILPACLSVLLFQLVYFLITKPHLYISISWLAWLQLSYSTDVQPADLRLWLANCTDVLSPILTKYSMHTPDSHLSSNIQFSSVPFKLGGYYNQKIPQPQTHNHLCVITFVQYRANRLRCHFMSPSYI